MDLRQLADFSKLKIKLASPENIREWSHGEITKPETINYRTLKPEKDGLFDERIFGPTKDWECYCGKYKRIRYKGIVCDKCGVEVTQSRVRRERMGHINLAVPVAHVWFFKGAPSKLSLVLDVPPKALEQVIYFARYLVTEVKEDGRTRAVKSIEEALKMRVQDITREEEEAVKRIKEEKDEKVKELSKKVKDKEQLALTEQEIELESRNSLVAVREDIASRKQRSEELFGKLVDITKSVKVNSLMSDEEYSELASYDAADFFEVEMGAEAVIQVLNKLNLDEVAVQIRKELEEVSDVKKIKLTKRLRLIDGMRRASVDPRWMVLKVLPVLPPDLRPMVQLSGGRFATSDLNDLYRRVINRNNRLRHLLELGAPGIILRNEKRMLQEAVDTLIDASQRQAARRGREKQYMRSLSDLLKGKQGRFRQNLLGKRVDYSGRSVIVVGPDLELNQCGLPKDMALEMFKPFVLREMIARGIAPNVKSAKNMLDRRPPEVFDILEEITKDHPVLLNRAPTLHKLGIQAFYPVLIEGSAIRVHPCVCSGYNADFDGDQMAVHLPLSKQAQDEAMALMSPAKNLLKPADGSFIAAPATKEMALGVYYLTSDEIILAGQEVEGKVFADSEDAISAYQKGVIRMREKVQVRVNGERVSTTVGRILFNETLPEYLQFFNEPASASVIKGLFAKALAQGTREDVVKMIDSIKNIGFIAGTASGLSFSVADALIYPEKDKMISEAAEELVKIEESFKMGFATSEERRRLTHQLWLDTTEELADLTWDNLPRNNSIKMIIEAGVGRTSRDQVKQLAAMRGLVVDPLGKIVDLPTKSNFREGLSIFEYVTSARGSRKGLTDSAIKTADAGYLTRRLVDVAHDVIIRLEDCNTEEGILIEKKQREKLYAPRLIGRIVARDVKAGNKVIVAKGGLITPEIMDQIEKSGIEEVFVRSPLTCSVRYGMCSKCYGADLSTRAVVEIGTPVGVVAAQSIGEPGTQLTMRTKHSGGIVGLDVTQGLPRVEELFEARIPKVLSPISAIPGKVEVTESEDGWIVRVRNTTTKPAEEREYIIPLTNALLVKDGDLIEAGKQLAGGALDVKEILAVKGLRAAQEYLLVEIQSVYESQGIKINDKHFEVIIRKMADKVQVISQGDTNLMPRDIIDRAVFEEENERVLSEGGEPATAQIVVLGVTRSSLFTDSWLSAASFQNTTSVLTDSSLLGREDKLIGLKENVIIGRLIPTSPERAKLPQMTKS
ncbi:MAG: DNA-directed RNA polymerase subunit beta' [Candidatus Blackburnbacteria bacterium RIFCSPHIGHO2_02_FULL_39_13]|uniref:DNA-directed RNA polymerase subunit beta' n=1 Tax=Candidatus Blackburnbacteria bacterium RIFCSPLOWO2_01_FULL_40_20 TaxID=1797519 RepID=A0A1G1VBF6_9BACT|nr:MAG: DNA-directed RNA polymerase subunit beta' [Microgenomates group bacterium GW2011_GWA2_39_19]OGY07707.1 MAG: DNA-directed RNA polymerase subunit beta' [Candidatus Blackburnbacteria bacterium RIFCSPHIGHO2_01_FULL_40_17]OGY07882.1 MAG: DNA-directed RNA polymerase subunit beta' [Candidatus Blackburnbacteria bacterium RIFCSPHIGHO2_02_FULL_39_13]OGY12597.1 MAG: DNA-directed RNA polymerase subunit beta' [Candidatus Blackburnbacteria bacterium RIFCSPLOWO2_01_FULL_40_20]OGY14742.1 MAG: DNA-direc